MNSDYKLTIKTVRHSEYSDEYEGREGLMKLPYKMLLQQSEVRNGQLLSEIDELRDTVKGLKARITELEAENKELMKGVLHDYRKEVKREEMYRTQEKKIEKMRKEIKDLRENNSFLMSRIIKLRNGGLPCKKNESHVGV